MEHYDVLIATPGKMLHAEYVQSLVDTIRELDKRGLSYRFLSKQSSFIPSGRELVALDKYEHDWETRAVGAGQYTYDKIFWIDSDMVWEPWQFMHILDSDEDVIGGLYATTPDGKVACATFHPEMDGEFPVKTHESHFFMQDEPVEVFGVGFGFVAMKQGVFEKCDRPWFKIEQIKWPELDFTTNVGEDYSWCMNARRNGFRVMVDPTIRVKHCKETFYELPPPRRHMSTKRKLIICRGVPASGKTTWALEWLAQDPLNRARVNRDDIRWMVFNSGHGTTVDESIVTRIHNAALQQLMHEGRDIVVDNTNLYKSNVSYLKKVARENGYVVEFRDFIVTYEEALKRDRARPRPVGDDVVDSFFQRYVIDGAGHLPKPPLN